jgi:orotidine-5'-phosphate decarboxylase
VVANGKTGDGDGLLVSSSRAILYAGNGEDYADAAHAAALGLRDEINRYR